MPKTFMPSFNDIEALKIHQLKGLQWTVAHAYQGSGFYRQKLEKSGVQPDGIKSLDDIQKLPFTTADDLREDYPFHCLQFPNHRWSEYMRHPVPPENAKFCHIRRKISTIGLIFSPGAMKWLALQRKTGCKSQSGTAFGQPVPAFNWDAKGSVPWRFRSVQVMWTCSVNFWWTCSLP
jgi:predicted nucleic acid-binding Zn ribbon protein